MFTLKIRRVSVHKHKSSHVSPQQPYGSFLHRLAHTAVPLSQFQSLYSICRTPCSVYWPSVWTCAAASHQFSDLLNPYYSWPHVLPEQRLRCLQFFVHLTHTHTHTHTHTAHLTWCAELGCSSWIGGVGERQREPWEEYLAGPSCFFFGFYFANIGLYFYVLLRGSPTHPI